MCLVEAYLKPVYIIQAILYTLSFNTETDCVNYRKYIRPDLSNFLGCTKMAKQV